MCSGDFSSLIRKNKENKPPIESPYDSIFVEQLKEFIPHLEEVKFYGGEPFMIPLYYEIWNLIVAMNSATRISIQTNATMLNSRIKILLERGVFHINISLDAIDKNIYESIRINAKYDLVMENVNWFIDYCKRKNTFIGISACAMQQNWKDIPNILSFCNKNQVQIYLHTVFFPQECALRTLDYKSINSILKFIAPFLNDLPTDTAIERKNKAHYADFVKQLEQWVDIALKSTSKIEINTPEEFFAFIQSKLDSPFSSHV
jgi:sulfatase maturation enzyme AslB (radical SAM superfamily)